MATSVRRASAFCSSAWLSERSSANRVLECSADAACYTAKDMGRNRIHVYHEDSFETAQRQQEMQRIVELNHAFDEQRFILYQQPIQSLNPDHDSQRRFCEVLSETTFLQ